MAQIDFRGTRPAAFFDERVDAVYVDGELASNRRRLLAPARDRRRR